MVLVGLETHVQLKTGTKMWCHCPNHYGVPRDQLTCPICLGKSGAVPVLNEEAVRLSVLAATYLQCEISPFFQFDRKHYHCVDLPKGYQLTQWFHPCGRHGKLVFESGGKLCQVEINRVHLEEDAAKLIHSQDDTIVDFNRAGVPLIEIVTEPQLYSSEMVYDYLTALKDVLLQGNISGCNMEQGNIRSDVNISISLPEKGIRGNKVELKNLNSFSNVKKAIEFEILRQTDLLKKGLPIHQETRRWDDIKKVTESMRDKETALDYHYTPDPDIPQYHYTPEWLAEIQSQCQEMPLDCKKRLKSDYNLSEEQARVLSHPDVDSGRSLLEFFEEAIKQGGSESLANAGQIANWCLNALLARMSAQNISWENLKLRPQYVAELVSLINSGKLHTRLAQNVFAECVTTGKSPSEIIQKKGLAEVFSEETLTEFCRHAIQSNPKPAADYRGGKKTALNFLKGQVMKLSGGKANPNRVAPLLEKLLQHP